MSHTQVLDYWFGSWDDSVPLPDDDAEKRRWWSGLPAVDAEIREGFGALHAEVAGGAHPDWEETPRGLLASVVTLDQFSRCLHRGSSRAFAFDAAARRLTSLALQRAWDRDMALIERAFLYMPLMHAEDRASQRRALMLFTSLAEEAEEVGLVRADYYRGVVRFAVEHKEIIDRFGRYPHRNFPLERTSTPEEMEFIDAEGSAF